MIMSSNSGGNMNNDDVVVGQWLETSQQNKSEQGSNLVFFAVEYVQSQEGASSDDVPSSRSYTSYNHGEAHQFVDINESDFPSTSSTSTHLETVPPPPLPRSLPSPTHINGGENFYPHSSSHSTSPPLQYTQFTSDALSQTFSTSDLILSSEQCAEMLKSGVKLELVLPNGSLAYGVMEPATKSINLQIPNEFLASLARSQHTVDTEDSELEGRRFDSYHMVGFDTNPDGSSGVARKFESLIRVSQDEQSGEGQRYETPSGATAMETHRYSSHGVEVEHGRRFDHLPEVVSTRIESHFRADVDVRRLRPMDMEYAHHTGVLDARVFESDPLEERHFDTHPTSDARHFDSHATTDERHFESHSTPDNRAFETLTSFEGRDAMDRFSDSHLTRNFDSHSLSSRNFETHLAVRNFESHSDTERNLGNPERNFETPPTAEMRTYETLSQARPFEPHSETERTYESHCQPHTETERIYEPHSQSDRIFESHSEPLRSLDSDRERSTQPLDCSTSLNAIDHRLEEIRIIQESLEEDSLEPSLLEDGGLLSRLDTECLLSICDKPVPSRAKATLPASFLYFGSVPDSAEECVFARRRIPKFSRFGPVEGILIEDLISSYELEAKRESLHTEELFYLIEVEPGRFQQLDVSDQEASNWMRFVRPARTPQEQNLALHQRGNALYFTSIKDVRVKQELRVWYAQEYAHKRCLPLLEPPHMAPSCLSDILGRLDRTEKCPHCEDYFAKENLREHIISVHNAPCQTSVESSKPSAPASCINDEQGETKEPDDEFDRIDFCQKKVRISERIASQKTQGGSKRPVPLEPSLVNLPEAESTPHPPDTAHEDSTPPVLSRRKTHECTTCRKAFPKGFNLKRHILSHLPEQRYPCQFCQKNFTQELYRDKHIRNLHSKDEAGISLLPSSTSNEENESWTCHKCGVGFASFATFLLHMQSHESGGDDMCNDENKLFDDLNSSGHHHQCPECASSFASREQVLRHIVSAHARSEDTWLVCELCSRAFHSAQALERHKKMATDTSLPFRCAQCCKRFNTAIALQGHIRVHGHPVFQCPMCDGQFETLQCMRTHIKTHLINGFYYCPRCPKKFTEYQVIRKHIRSFHSNRQFACHVCAKLFPSPDKLRMHMLRHSDHREFLCANCGKQFKRKDKLKEHMVRQHNPDENQKLDLPSLPPENKEEKKKILPLSTHSGGNQPSPQPGVVSVAPPGGRGSDYSSAPYKCHPCLLGFKRRGMLVNHLAARHPDIRPETVPELSMPILKTARDYYCQYCDKIYKSSSKRKSHILKNHPGQALPLSNRMKLGRSDSDELPNPSFCQTVGSISATPQQCQWCHKQYASKAKLLQHQRKKHPEDLSPELRVPRLSKQSSSEDDTSRSGGAGAANLPPCSTTQSPAPPHSGLSSSHVDMTSHMEFDAKPESDLFSSTSSPYPPPSSRRPHHNRPRLMKQDRVVEEDSGCGGAGGMVEMTGGEVYELTTELCPETLELLRKQFKLEAVGDPGLETALEDKTLTSEQLLKLFALNGVTIVTEQPSDVNAATNYAVFTSYPPR